MKMHLFKTYLCVLALALVANQGSSARQELRRNAQDIPVVQPVRRAPDAPPALPADLPHVADTITPLTFELEIRETSRGEQRITRRQISRTSERIHVVIDKQREWLFTRNPVDPRRVSGELIDHRRRVIVHHDESDLRNLVGVAGWVDVLSNGIAPDALRQLRLSADTSRTVSGVVFQRFQAATRESALRDVWWSREEALAMFFESQTATRSTQVSIRKLTKGINRSLLANPADRFPEYSVQDVAEWLEGK